MADISMIVLRDGKFDTAHGTSKETLDKIFNELRQSQAKRVVVHFHGGLVDREAGIAGAEMLDKVYRQTDSAPIFFVWESGWKEILTQNLPAIFQENIFQKILAYLMRFAKGKINNAIETGTPRAAGDLLLPKRLEVEEEMAAPSDGKEPYGYVDPHVLPPGDELTEAEEKQLRDSMEDDPEFEVLGQEIANSLTEPGEANAVSKGASTVASTTTLMNPDVVRELTSTEEGAKGVFSTALLIAKCGLTLQRIVKRFVQHRDHGFYLTIVEEILRAFYIGNAGKFLWDGIKQETVDAFGFDPACGGSQFLSSLESFWKSGQRPQIALVGHSAGAIYVCRLLQEAQNCKLPDDLRFNVILLAPACDFKLLAKTLQSAGNRITGLRVFGMGDDLERKDAIAGVIYPSSLLYFVSGVTEDESDKPLAGMARFYQGQYIEAGFPDIDYVRASSLFKKDNSLVWAMSAVGDGMACDMESHGGWANATQTVKSVQYILEKGFGDGGPA
jgi:hypothetical protein